LGLWDLNKQERKICNIIGVKWGEERCIVGFVGEKKRIKKKNQSESSKENLHKTKQKKKKKI